MARTGGFVGSDILALRREFEQLGLNGSEAQVLVAVLQVGSGSASQLARLAGVPRPSVYGVLEGLSVKRLAEPIPGKVTRWASPGKDGVLDRLYDAQEERLRQLRARMDQARELLNRALPKAASSASLPYIHLLSDRSQTGGVFRRLMAGAKFEALLFSRPPYTTVAGNADPVQLESLARGVNWRVVYQIAQVEGPASEAFRREVETLMEAGLQGRATEEVPMKLAVFDRTSALVATEPALPASGYPTALLIEHPGFAAVLADAFEQRWAAARAYRPPHRRGPASADPARVGRRAN